MSSFHIRPGGALTGRIRVPGDKSVSHRALLFGALAQGTTEIHGILTGSDCQATADAVRALGAHVDWPDHDAPVIVEGLAGHLRPVEKTLDMGNSGTGMRLLAGVLAGQPFSTRITGDKSLRRRPMGRITDPLRRMGATIETMAGELAPLTITGKRPLLPLRYEMPMASAQLKSCLLLAGLYADGQTACLEPAVTRDHTERLLEQFGVTIFRDNGWVGVNGGSTLRGTQVTVPGDLSSAAFLLAGAAMAPHSDLVLEAVGINPTRTGVLTVLEQMGARIQVMNQRQFGEEPVADIRVQGAPLRGVDIAPELVPLAIDEFPALMVAAACAEGTTTLTGAQELRVKESDRIAAIAAGLRALGAEVQDTADGLRVNGCESFKGGTVDSGGDHRIAMAFSMASLNASAPITINDVDNVATSFPNFVELACGCGLRIEDGA